MWLFGYAKDFRRKISLNFVNCVNYEIRACGNTTHSPYNPQQLTHSFYGLFSMENFNKFKKKFFFGKKLYLKFQKKNYFFLWNRDLVRIGFISKKLLAVICLTRWIIRPGFGLGKFRYRTGGPGGLSPWLGLGLGKLRYLMGGPGACPLVQGSG